MTTLDGLRFIYLHGNIRAINSNRPATLDAFLRVVDPPGWAEDRCAEALPIIIGNDPQAARAAAFDLWCTFDDASRIGLTEWAWIAWQCGIICPEAFGVLIRESWIRGKTSSLLSVKRGWPRQEVAEMFRVVGMTHLMEPEEMTTLAAMPDSIAVYRGANGISAAKVRHGMSWTTDEACAVWFANRGGDEPVVLRATVAKADVLAYFDHESEIVVRPGRAVKSKRIDAPRRSVSYENRAQLLEFNMIAATDMAGVGQGQWA